MEPEEVFRQALADYVASFSGDGNVMVGDFAVAVEYHDGDGEPYATRFSSASVWREMGLLRWALASVEGRLGQLEDDL